MFLLKWSDKPTVARKKKSHKKNPSGKNILVFIYIQCYGPYFIFKEFYCIYSERCFIVLYMKEEMRCLSEFDPISITLLTFSKEYTEWIQE